MAFYLHFLTLTVKVEQNKNKIDNIKIIMNLLPELGPVYMEVGDPR